MDCLMFACGQNTCAQSYLTGSHQEPRFSLALWQVPLTVGYRVHLSPTGQDFSVCLSFLQIPPVGSVHLYKIQYFVIVMVITWSLGCTFLDIPANVEKFLTSLCLVYTTGKQRLFQGGKSRNQVKQFSFALLAGQTNQLSRLISSLMFTDPSSGTKFSEPSLWFQDECSALLQLLKGKLLA